MIYQNNNGVVVLAIAAMILCGILGLVLGLDPFGPGASVRAAQAGTRMALNAQATEGALQAQQTPEAMSRNQTAVAADLTAMPMNQTATAVAGIIAIGNAHATATQDAVDADRQAYQAAAQATQTTLAQQQLLDSLAFNATATAFAAASMGGPSDSGLFLAFGGAAGVVIGLWLLMRAIMQVVRARTQARIAKAHLILAEQRRLRALQGARRPQNEDRDLPNPIPTTLVTRPGNGRGMPHAE